MNIYIVVNPDGDYYGCRDIVKIFKIKKDAEKYIKNHPYELEIDEYTLE